MYKSEHDERKQMSPSSKQANGEAAGSQEPSQWRPPVLETQRLRLRPLSLDDVMSIYEYAKNSENVRYTGFDRAESAKDTLEFVEHTLNIRYNERHEGEWAIELKGSPGAEMLGTIGCFFAKDDRKIVELGYILTQDHWGKGYVSEAACAVRDWAFENYDIHRLQARCVSENIGSWKIMEKIGMQCEGTLRKFFKRGDHYWDFKIYSLLREEWSQQFQRHSAQDKG